jgi:putative membrane protein
VLLFAGASVLHAAATRGYAWAVGLLVVAGGIGLAAEAVGVRTGFPFGHYEYTGTLGPEVLDVPVVVPLAWVMMAYPCLLLGRRLARAGARRSRRGTPSSLVVVLTAGRR